MINYEVIIKAGSTLELLFMKKWWDLEQNAGY